jgi:hypothetical protein
LQADIASCTRNRVRCNCHEQAIQYASAACNTQCQHQGWMSSSLATQAPALDAVAPEPHPVLAMAPGVAHGLQQQGAQHPQLGFAGLIWRS